MRKQDMVCWKCLSFERKIERCKEKPGKEIQIENPDTNWCGSGSWRENGQTIYWGQWRLLEETKAELFKEAWNNLRLKMGIGDEEYVSLYGQIVLSRSEEVTMDDIIDILGSEEARNYVAWKSLLFDKSNTIRLEDIKQRADELDYP
jgi:hypothetical protein